jgi:2-polyprenyl-6-hydroxyphenyl methylase/3-demethylubiquinone-9 3-methyltransferase
VGELAKLGLGRFDLVTCLEVIEHVADKPAFVRQLASHLAPGGLMVLSTPNRTAASRLLMVGAAEALGTIPKGTHHWGDFITPEELADLLAQAGLRMRLLRGISWSPAKGLHLSDNVALNYIVTATAA